MASNDDKNDSDDNETSFDKEFLEAHNYYRRKVRLKHLSRVYYSSLFKHDVPDLTLNDELSEQAQRWAEKLAKRQYMSYCELAGYFYYIGRIKEIIIYLVLGIGENITFFPANMTPRQMVDYWYHENRKYEYETPGWQTGTNYFTQVIWRSTKEVRFYHISLRISNSSRLKQIEN